MESQDVRKLILTALQLILLLSTVTEGTKTVNQAEMELMTKLFPKTPSSMKDVLPIVSDGSPVNVSLQIALRQLMDVHEKDQIISLSVWVRQYWNNPMLKWNKTKYGNISSINVDRNLVWVPDICLYNTADDSGSLYQRLDTKLIINHNGDCKWLAPIILKSECKINVRYFPFDEQSCILEFGSWTYSSKRIDIKPFTATADTSVYIENGEWKMVEVPAIRHESFYPCCTEPFPSIIFTVRIRRRILYYVSNLIVPCGVIAALAFLSFYLPADCGERISLVITVLLAMTVYMLMVSNAMPPTSEVIPLIGKFYLAVMIEIALCLVATCITIRWHHTTAPMSPRLRTIFVRCLWPRLCGRNNDEKGKQILQVSSGKTSYNLNNNQRALATIGEYDVVKPSNASSVQLREILNNPVSEMESIRKDLGVLSNKVETEQSEDEIRHDWKKAGEVLDRLFFILFSMTFLIFSAIIFVAIPSYKD